MIKKLKKEIIIMKINKKKKMKISKKMKIKIKKEIQKNKMMKKR